MLQTHKLKGMIEDLLGTAPRSDLSVVPLEAAELVAYELGLTVKVVESRRHTNLKVGTNPVCFDRVVLALQPVRNGCALGAAAA